jgi:hypothetical protein
MNCTNGARIIVRSFLAGFLLFSRFIECSISVLGVLYCIWIHLWNLRIVQVFEYIPLETSLSSRYLGRPTV